MGTNGLGRVELGRNPGAAGVINIGSAPGSVATDTAGWVDASEIRFGAGAGTLNFNSVGPVIFTPALNSLGAGRHELNHYAGSTQLQGDNSRFAGNTTVSGGRRSEQWVYRRGDFGGPTQYVYIESGRVRSMQTTGESGSSR